MVEAPPEGVTALVETLTEAGVAFEQGRTWTTDAIYRETRSRVQRRIAQGCAVVEMEAAAFFAVAAYRGVSLGQMLFSADSLAGDAWDHRSWHRAQDAHRAVFWLAMDAAVRLAEQGSAGEPYVPARVGDCDRKRFAGPVTSLDHRPTRRREHHGIPRQALRPL